MYPLAALSLLRPRLAYTTSSVTAGMRGAKAAVKPHDANKKKLKNVYTEWLLFLEKGPLSAPHIFRCSFGRTAKSRVWPIHHWGEEAYSNP